MQPPLIECTRHVSRIRVLVVVLLVVAASCGGTDDTTAPSSPAATDRSTAVTDTDSTATADSTETTEPAPTTEPPFVPEPLTIELLAELDPEIDGPTSAVVLGDRILTQESPPAVPGALVAYDTATGATIAQELTWINEVATTASGKIIGFDIFECSAQIVDPFDLSVGARFPSVGDGRSCSGGILLVRDEQVWIAERAELYALDTSTGLQQQVQWNVERPFDENRSGAGSMWDLGDAVLVEFFGPDRRSGVARIGPDLVVDRFVELPGRIIDGPEGFVVESVSEDTPGTFPLDPATLELGESIDLGIPGDCEFGGRTPAVNGEVWVGPVSQADGSVTVRLCIDGQFVAEGSGDLGDSVVLLAAGDGVLFLFAVERADDTGEVTARRLYRVERG